GGVDLRGVVGRLGGIDEGAERVGSQNLGEMLAVEFPPRRQRGRQGVMADDRRLVAGERRRAESVVWMDMRDQQVANGLVRPLPDFSAKPLAVGETTAGIGDKHAV